MSLDPRFQTPYYPEITTELIHCDIFDIDGNAHPAIVEIEVNLMEVTVTNISCPANVLYNGCKDDINDAITGRYKYAEIQPYKI